MVIGTTAAAGALQMITVGDEPGLTTLRSDTELELDDLSGHGVRDGAPAGCIAFVPGYGETLRSNRRTDTLHNLMGDPRVALLAMQPGSRHVAEVRGAAQVCTDRTLLASMRLRDRTPKAALVIDVERGEVRDEPVLAAALWGQHHAHAGSLPRAATIWADHVRRTTSSGTGAKVARRLVNERAIAAGIAYDHRTNL